MFLGDYEYLDKNLHISAQTHLYVMGHVFRPITHHVQMYSLYKSKITNLAILCKEG